MAAVQEDGHALQYVQNQTLEICMAAVQQIGASCKYIKSELFDHDEYIYMIYIAIFKSRIFADCLHYDSVENRIEYLYKNGSYFTDKLINEITAIKSRSTKRAL
jgi:hypothetical protein